MLSVEYLAVCTIIEHKMGSSEVGLRLGLVFWAWCVLWSDGKDLWDGSSHLQCGIDNMVLSFPVSLEGLAFSLLVLDFQGKPHSLTNNSACGFWTSKRNDIMLLNAAYNGCYVTEENGEYVMTLFLEEVTNGGVEQYKVEKRCPVMTAKDAPSPSVCSAVSQVDKLPCVSAPVSQVVCEEVGCCFSSNDFTMPCFYGNKLTTQCTSDNLMVVAVSKDLTIPSLNLSSVRVVGLDSSTCAGMSMSMSASFAVFQFPLGCVSSRQVPGSSIVYESTIEAARNTISWQGSTITRDSTMRVTVRCSYSQTDTVTVKAGVSTLPPPLPVSTSGPLLMEMRIAQDMSYSSYFSDQDFPVVKVLRDPVYLEVRLLHRTDPKLVLVLNDCWATNSVDSTLIPQWPILLNRCPFDGDNYISQVIPAGSPTQSLPYPTHYQRFVVKTFTFVDQSTQIALEGLVYFHCSASACFPSATDRCITSCAQRKRRMAEDIESEPLENVVTSNGPVQFLPVDGETLNLKGVFHSEYSTLDIVRAIAAGGVAMMVFIVFLGIWLHHKAQSKKHKLNA
ncbi:zona pellucida sperm-binding protein 4-like isoform X1 [Hyla sarda]|uniref:zona pellucida sperm-binding protein 4-like isoform X1 n=2 Tax=Hyla sarda TaxID=327740 RepID=UPI0024C430A5|nr:zona pellucida sperm-binding protein 4-like isoform X1 [Hyla sarda]